MNTCFRQVNVCLSFGHNIKINYNDTTKIDRIHLEDELKGQQNATETCQHKNHERHQQLMDFDEAIRNGSLVWVNKCNGWFC